MKKLLKVFFILSIMLTFFMNLSVFAADSESATDTSTSTILIGASNSNSKDDSSTKVSSLPSVNEGELQLTDILNILLIATGVVIILLAIAILIKLK